MAIRTTGLGIAAGACALLWGGMAAAACTTYPYSFSTGTVAYASQVNADFACAALTGNGLFTGNVGIGTTAPTAALDFGTSYGLIKLALYANSGGGNYFGIGVNSGALTFGVGLALVTSPPQMVFATPGYLGIGTTTPGYPLHVVGTAYATSAGGALSDIRHKDNVQTLGAGSLDLVEKLRPVTFTWKEPTDDGMQGEQIGFIAQEVQKVLPSVILTQNNDEQTLGIKYTELIPVLTKAIQEQQAEIATLQAKVAALQGTH